jgi:hypothetical protein
MKYIKLFEDFSYLDETIANANDLKNKVGDNFQGLDKLTKIGNDIYISYDITKLPKGYIVVEHGHDEELKHGELGIFTGELGWAAAEFGNKTAYVAIGEKAKVITIENTAEFLDERGEYNKPNEYIIEKYKKYGFKTFDDLMDDAGSLDNPSTAWYELQKKTIEILNNEVGHFDVLEMKSEDDLTPHQYLILGVKENVLFEANKVLYQGYKGYSYKHSGQDFIIWNSGSDWYYEGRILKDNLSERDYAKHYPTKKQAKQRAEEFIDDILSKKDKITEAIDPIIGTNVTFVAKHKEKGYGFGSGFTLSRKTVNNKFVSIIDCKAGTEVTGEVIGVYTMPVKMWKIKLEDGYYAMIDSDFFYIKP